MKTYPKRLIEVDLPIKRISEHARPEKTTVHGNISTLHIWWARRPHAACRAVLCATLWPDPADKECPQEFRTEACRLLSEFARSATSDKTLAAKCSKEAWIKWQAIAKQGALKGDNESHWNIIRFLLLDFIADFSHWNNQSTPQYLDTARSLTKAADKALGGEPGTVPLVFDPFAGGGAIPLEALRLGVDAFASDLNPLAVVLNKVVLEFIPRYGSKLADAVKTLSGEIKEDAAKHLSACYPLDPDGNMPLTYLWARTVRCEGPGCGYRIPLIRTTKLGEQVNLKLTPDQSTKTFRVSVVHVDAEDRPTVKGGSVSCPAPGCNFTTLANAVKKQLIAKQGGAKDAQLLAVLVEKNGLRVFRSPSDRDDHAVQMANSANFSELPSAKINPIRPHKNTRGLSAVTRIGINRFVDLYSSRQMLAIQEFSNAIKRAIDKDALDDLRRAALSVIGLSFGRILHQNCSCSRWRNSAEAVAGAFGKQALQVTWDFAETTPLTHAAGGWDAAIEWALKVIDLNKNMPGHGTVVSSPAQEFPLPNESASVLFTDPPYFAAIPYADLSNFFYVWERPFFAKLYPDLFSAPEIVQEREVIVTDANVGIEGTKKDEHFFRREMTHSLKRAREVLMPTGIGVIVFADTRTSSWEALLGAVVDSGWVITASWPIDTESQTRTQAQGSASLQSSVHLVVRPRENADGQSASENIGDWRDVLTELPKRIHEWMPRLQSEGVVGADAIFACLGPALEGFSRYSKVEKPNGEVVELKEYLVQVWAAVSREALSMIFAGADTTGFEEDARLTAMWLWTLSSGPSNGASAEAGDIENSGEDDSDEKPAKTVKATRSLTA
jgi:putative DNA methylase